MSEAERTSTIVGVATGRPDGGVAIVRISGGRARAVAAGVIVGELPRARRVGLRRLRVGEEALVVLMPGPNSFTGEDVVELQIHAGERNVGQVVEAVLAAGAEAAGAGDFTRRAFENGRLTLDQAEGIAAIIGARTQAALDQGRRLLAGELGAAVEELRGRADRLRVEIEANLDFPEDVAAADEDRFARTAGALEAELRAWLGRFEAGRRARERARVVLAGPPNAGKSALFNALLGRRRALVSAEAGTTRDYVEAELELGGRSMVLVDTAGLRASADTIEVAGVELGREQIAGADVIVWVEAADAPEHPAVEAELAAASSTGARILEVENKADLQGEGEEESARAEWISLSASTGAGLEGLRQALIEATAVGEQWIGLARHRDRAAEAAEALADARGELESQAGLELAAFSLSVATRRLGEITGAAGPGAIGTEVLDAIFSSFCIGK